MERMRKIYSSVKIASNLAIKNVTGYLLITGFLHNHYTKLLCTCYQF